MGGVEVPLIFVASSINSTHAIRQNMIAVKYSVELILPPVALLT